MLPLDSATQAPVTPLAFRLPNSVAAVPSVSSGLQRNVITELFEGAEDPLTNLFLTVVGKGVPSGPG